MIYVMSDIHGQYEKYQKMLEKICFSDQDELYILGDVVDRGPHPIRVLQDMSMRYNVFPILGNHDYMAAYILSKLNVQITEENCETHLDSSDIQLLSSWLIDGGDTTLTEYKKLSLEEREYVLEYFSEFTPYEELTIGERHFVLVHGGLSPFEPNQSLSQYELFSLLTTRPDYTKPYFSDKFLVTGHTPTCMIAEEYSGTIYQKNNHIAIDCGAGWNMPLGCIRLDDFCEFYIE